MPPLLDLQGQRFGRLLVIEFVRIDGLPRWRCRCECGTITVQTAGYLRHARGPKSCGCLTRDVSSARSFKHGHTRHGNRCTPEYRAWACAIQRCTNPRIKNYANYGGRGIRFDDAWRHDFRLFLDYMGLKPTPAHTLERLDSNGHYEPGNCVWATRLTQGNNTSRNRHIVVHGLSLTIAEAARRFGMEYWYVYSAVRRGRTPEEIFGKAAGLWT